MSKGQLNDWLMDAEAELAAAIEAYGPDSPWIPAYRAEVNEARRQAREVQRLFK